MTAGPEFYRFHNGEKAKNPFSQTEYQSRLAGLHKIMAEIGTEAAVFTSMQSIAYYSGFLYCASGRAYALVVTDSEDVSISAGIDAGQPWRRCSGDNITYTDWQRDNFWCAIRSVTGAGKAIGYEGDHLSLALSDKLEAVLGPSTKTNIAQAVMRQRTVKSEAEIDLIRAGARVADIGDNAIRDAVAEGLREIDIAMQGRDAMETAIAEAYPDAEYRDTWVCFQSGLNTDGPHKPVTSRRFKRSDNLSLNTFPMISGYYIALERTMFVGQVDAASLAIWQTHVAAHEYGMALLQPGASCTEVTEKINQFFAERDLLQYRTFCYWHSFAVLSHYYGREAGLELREDIDTVLTPWMVISIEPMLTIGQCQAGAGGYREHDILVITEAGNENITGYPYGPEFNVIG